MTRFSFKMLAACCLLIALFASQFSIAQSFSTSNLKGLPLVNPTSLQFGPDGRLYVSEQKGTIYACTITRNGDNDYSVTKKETIDLVKSIQNYNDNGSVYNGAVERQITGILVTGTAEFPVLYVGSSDYRIGAGTSLGDVNLDTNSGIISRLTWNGTSWTKVDLIRGLPRSEENHANNGMQLDKEKNILYVASGGNTNGGGPSNNFAFITEYALAAAILAIDLNVIDNKPVYTDQRTGAKFVYDLPTLDDPTRPNITNTHAEFPYGPTHPLYNSAVDLGDPFGGNDGLNQTKIVKGEPVQVFAPGFRNIYDLVLTKDGRLYTWDNGANGGWGGHPHHEGGGQVTNNWVASNLPDSKSGSMTSGWVGEDGVQDAPVNNKDGLHLVGYTSDYNPFTTAANPADAYYGGHPTPIRANPAGAGLYTHDHALGTFNNNGFVGGYWRTAKTNNPATTLPVDWPPVPLSQANPIEGNFLNAGTEDPSFWSFEGMKSYSTNGLAMYNASNFNGAMQGHLLAASHNHTIYEIHLNENGTINNPRVDINNNTDVEVFAQNVGNIPLDIVAQGDGEIFQGTVWTANYGSNTITVFEPQDYFNCPLPGAASYDPVADYDQDGYTNQDEIATGSDPCNGASQPKDADQDFIPDALDPDDDNDGVSDVTDNFQLDPKNGLTTKLPIKYPLLNGDPGTGIAGLGFTGLMNNGSDYANLIKDKSNSNVIVLYGGAPGQLGIGGPPGEPVPPGDAYGTFNDQKNAFQFGVNVTSTTSPFTVSSEIVGPIFATTPQNHQSAGIYIGTGSQSDYLKIVANANGGSGGIQVVFEKNNVPMSFQYNVPAVSNASYFKLLLSVNPQQGTVQPKYSLAGGAIVPVGSPIAVSGALLNAIQNQPALAVGVIATTRGSTSPFEVSWDNIEITYDPLTATGQWQAVVPQSGLPTKRHENAYVQAGDKFYLLGGRGSQNKKVDIYDPVKKTWTQSNSTHPIELHHFQAVAYKGLIYIVGAFTGNYPGETPVEQIYIYNPVADTWHVDGTIPRARGSAGAVVFNDKIYLIGGLLDGHKGNYVQWFDEYDPKTGTWKTLSNVPHFRDHFQGAVVNGKLVIAGGRLSDSDQNLASQNYDPQLLPPLPPSTNVFNVTVPMVDIYDFGSGTWSNQNLPPLPTPRGGTASAVLGSEVLVIGGESGTSTDAHSETEAFDVNLKTWRSLAPLLPEGSFKGRHATQAIVNNGAVYIAAGSGKQGGTSSTELNSQQVFSLSGELTPTGTPLTKSQLTASPSSLNYGPIAPSQTVNKTVVLTNTSGNQAIDLLNVSISGNTAFSLVAPPPSKLLLPGETMNIGVAVKPSATDQGTITGSLSIKHTANTAPLSIALAAEVTNDGGDTAPQVQNPIANSTVAQGAAAQTIDLSSVFTDDGGSNNLTYSASSANPSVATTSVSGSILTLTFGSVGTAQVTATATDAGGQATDQVFTVTVSDGNTPTPTLALNAGGGAVQHGGINWQADQYFSGGSAFVGTNAIAGTENDAIYQSERWGSMSYNIPVTNGTYQLQLHFAEIYLANGATGKRVFDVTVEGKKVLANFDILSKTGGQANTAWVETIAGVSVSDGVLNISFGKVVENPKVSAIALYGSSSTPTNQSPTVNAGVDQTLTLPTNNVTLTATASDSDGSIASYVWTKVSGPSASLSGTSTSQLTASSLVAGSYTFQVKVTDDKGATASDQVNVTVNQQSGGGGNVALWLEAECASVGSNWQVATNSGASNGSYLVYPTGNSMTSAPTSAADHVVFTVNIGQAGSYHLFARVKAPSDSDNSFWVQVDNGPWLKWWEGIAVSNSFAWNEVLNSPFSLSAGTHTIKIGYREDGTQLDKLLLSQSASLPSGTGQTASNCSSTPTNQPPTVNAGSDKTLTLPTNNVVLTATASDSDGSIASYAWTKVSGPSASLSGTSTSQLTASSLVAGSYVFQVKVTDNQGASASDQVNVTVNQQSGGGGNALVLALNAGGGAVQHGGINWQADQYFSGGSAFVGTNAIAGTENDAIYQSERWGSMSYNIPVTNGTYQLQLHFAEIYLANGATGKRVFDVTVEGKKVLANFDILSKTGGQANTAWVETIAGVSVSDGVLNISFGKVVENPKVSAIALYGSSSTPTNQSPTVNAGVDQTLTLPTNNVTLTATASDSDGSIASYVWTKVSGPSASLSGTSTSQLTASSLVAGSYTFQVKVTDDKGATASDQVNVTVNQQSGGGGNVALWLEAECASVGSNWQVATNSGASNGSYLVYPTGNSMTSAPTSAADHVVFTVNIGQAGSYHLFARVKAPSDSDNSFWVQVDNGPWLKWWEGIAVSNSFAWNEVLNSPFSLSAGTHTIKIGYREDGTQLDKLLLSQSASLPSGTGQTASNCSSTPTNQPPTVNAGSDKTLTLPTNNVVLTATASDSDGSIASYAWTKVSGPSASLSGTSTSQLTASSLVAGSYVFQVKVTDNQGASASDQVNVTVNQQSGGGGNALVLALNAGGGAVQHGGINWQADQYFSGGSAFVGTNAIAGTENDAIYQSERWGSMSYNIPVTNGTYQLQLHFAEIYLANGATGKRVFDVTVEGKKVLANFDILSKTGGQANTAWVETIAGVSVSDGVLNISFGKVVENPKVSAIALYGSSGTASSLAARTFSTKGKYFDAAMPPLSVTDHEDRFIVYPIPFEDQITIQLKDNLATDVTVELYTASGVEIPVLSHDISRENDRIILDLPNRVYGGDMLILVVKDSLGQWYTTRKLLRAN